MPLSLGDVRVGETRWQIAGNVAGAAAPVVPLRHTHYHFTPAPISDANVERIAKRVAELLKAVQ